MRLRSLLFVPGDSEHKFAKASSIGADALILDLEDAVAPPRKALAREMVKNLLGGPARDWAFLVRINPLGSGLTLEDLAAIVRPGLDGILIPKVSGVADIELISNYVDALEIAAGVTPGHVKLLVVATETPAAMIGFASYATPSRRLVAMTWGAEDLGARVHGPATQGEFLKRLGIETRAVTLMGKTTPEVSADISSALKRLTDSGRGSMGSMFKVLAVTEPHLTSVAGLSDEQAPGTDTP